MFFFFFFSRIASFWTQFHRACMFGWAKRVRLKKRSSLLSARKFSLKRRTIQHGQEYANLYSTCIVFKFKMLNLVKLTIFFFCDPQVVRVIEGGEPTAFKQYFDGWKDNGRPSL